jgi:hypothetical protein
MTLTNEQAALFASSSENANKEWPASPEDVVHRAATYLKWLQQASTPSRSVMRGGIAYDRVLGRKAEFCGTAGDHEAHVNRLGGADLLTGGEETACPGYGSLSTRAPRADA